MLSGAQGVLKSNDVSREREVVSEIVRLEKLADELQEEIGNCAQVFSPILKPTQPRLTDNEKKSPPPICELAAMLNNQCAKIEQSILELRDLRSKSQI
jgi:hypothetical protein